MAIVKLAVAKDWYLKPSNGARRTTSAYKIKSDLQVIKSEDLPEFLDVKDVAKHLNMSPRSVERYFMSGIIHTTKVRGRRLTTVEWLAEFLNNELRKNG